MRHVYIRGILALIWLAAAVVSGLSGNLEWVFILFQKQIYSGMTAGSVKG